ncbi:hypothetical protein DRP43_02690, partial [candidate division TA06 bacterium]
YSYDISEDKHIVSEFHIRKIMKEFNEYIGVSNLKVSIPDYNKTNYSPIDYLIKQSNNVYLKLIGIYE